jgi:uncharacterized membrane protein YkoI
MKRQVLSRLLLATMMIAPLACSHEAAPRATGHGQTAQRTADDEDDVPVTQAELPSAVQATVTAQSKGATIHGLSKSMEDGRLTYELELVMADGHRKDMDIDPQGSIHEVEEQVELTSVPARAKSVILAKAGDRKITRVEALANGEGTLYGYEVGVTDGSKHSEFRVDLNGKPLPDEDDD